MENLVIEKLVRMSSSAEFWETDQWPDLDKLHIFAMPHEIATNWPRTFVLQYNELCLRATLIHLESNFVDRQGF